ncbi:MAG: peptidoglycan DD-metalloendopeptidase family protein [Gammaproteobacteria bacterium]|nr:peptidoglycan DD-metalloendopeptidase family protein [Gammaproteobacteria bacterium]
MSYPTFRQPGLQRHLNGYASRFRLRSIHWLALGTAIFCGSALISYISHDSAATQSNDVAQGLALPNTPPGVETTDQPAAHHSDAAALEEIITASVTPATELPAEQRPAQDEAQTADAEPATENDDWQEVTVTKGDSLAQIFSRSGVDARDLHEVMTLGAAVNTLKRIHPGQILNLRADETGRLQELRYEESHTLGLRVAREGDNFTATTIHRIPDRQTAHASAVIESSLFMAGQKAKLPDVMIMNLAGIFGWDIDFALDIRAGDRFTVLYDELYLDGERIGEGNILAAEFVNRGETFRAVRYTDAEGRTDYYTPDGRSLRKAFLRTPVEFSRISSGFNLKRKHPVLNRIRAHKGVDYAAPQGTPIKATGDGRVVFRGVKGGYGNVIVIQHGSTYSTLYAHMSRYAKGINSGTRVRQGQTIGYVGMTGLATGPHLHYEFLVNGGHRNPLTVKFPDSLPIEKRYRRDFEKQVATLIAQLELARDRDNQVALNEH